MPKSHTKNLKQGTRAAKLCPFCNESGGFAASFRIYLAL